MISRKTIFALLLALLVGGGLFAWKLNQRDDCDRLASDKRTTQTSVLVDAGTRSVMMPCSVWIPRQPLKVQLWCLADLALAVVFAVSFCADWNRRSAGRQRLR